MNHLEQSVLIKTINNWNSINIIKPRQVAEFFVYKDDRYIIITNPIFFV